MTCYIDLETYSATPLKNGTYVYAADAEVMLVTYAFGDGPVQLWDRTRDTRTPGDLLDYIYSIDLTGGTFTAHSSMFDRNVLRLTPDTNMRSLFEGVPIEAWRDTLVKALSHGLPGGLDRLGELLNIPMDQRKLKEGKKLIKLFCCPQKDGSRNTRYTHPQEWETFCEYAIQDIPSMRAIDHALPKWNSEGAQLALWHLDQHINDRGFLVDRDLCVAALDTVDREKSRQRTSTAALSGGELESTTQRDAFLTHVFMEYGVDLPNLKADTLERRLADQELPQALRDLIAIRLEVSSTTTTKYKTLLKAINTDGRMCGTLQFRGAQRTGRDAGRLFQPQNLMRIPKYVAVMYDDVVECIKEGAADLVYEKPIEVCGSVVRGSIIAPPGRKLAVADLSNIEGRKCAWLCGEQWKLDTFREADLHGGPDNYRVAYGAAFNVDPEDVDDWQRQIGKVMELFLQYQGGVGAFMTGAITYGIDIDKMASGVLPTLPRWAYDEAKDFLAWLRSDKKNIIKEEARGTRTGKRSTFGLTDESFIACDALKRLWRSRHPGNVAMWRLLEDTVRSAICTPGITFPCGKLKIRRDGAWLRIGLPSGRALCYASPQLTGERQVISYMGVDAYTRRWQRIYTYGGKLLENITQGSSADSMFDAVAPAEEEGFPIVLRVHDELVADVPDAPEFTGERLAEIMSVVQPWATGLPLHAKGITTSRYRKG